MVIPFEYEKITIEPSIGSGFVVLHKNGRFGSFAFKTGLLIPAEYFSVEPFYNFVKIEITPDVFGYIDDQGRKYWR
ncbi:MAG: hypothetical protein IAE67_03310 [Candidatus Competibacteraceae bacterium]|nr:hypothetical protein [Candidatus Competibacteraceae bacterium]